MSFAYDAAHRPASKLDQANNTISFAFDMGDRLTSRNYPDSNNDTFTFDLASRMLTASSARYGNTVTRTYDAAGRLTADNLTVGGATYTVGLGYNNADFNNSVTYPDGSVASASFTARNQISTIQYTPNGGAAANVAARTYDAGMRLGTTTYGNGLVETRTYRNDGGKVDNLIASIAIPNVTSFAYTYDANKNKTSETDGILNPYSWTTGAAGYDAKDRLTNWTRTNGDAQSWNLSLVGDWASTVVNGVTDTRTHNQVHELLTRSTAVTALAYDPKGNLTTNSNGQTYTWDFDNRMASAAVSGTTTSYAYDALGRRVSKSTGGTTTLYMSLLNQEIAEHQSGSLIHKYVFGGYVDEPLMLVNVSGTTETNYYYHANGLYCVAALTDSTGTPQERYIYNAYGKVTILDGTGTSVLASSTVSNALLYTGRRLDPETGLYYYRARYYDADAGRFVERDPANYEDGFGLYQYCRSSSENFVDPAGDASEAVNPPGATRPGAFPPKFKPISLPDGKDRVDIPLEKGLQLLGLSDPQRWIKNGSFKRGCVDLWNTITGIQITHCFKTPEEADKFECPKKAIRMTGAIQGYPDGPLTPGENGEIKPTQVATTNGEFNFAVQQPNGSYIFMNHGDMKDPKDPQNIIVSKHLPAVPSKKDPPWTTIYCVMCVY